MSDDVQHPNRGADPHAPVDMASYRRRGWRRWRRDERPPKPKLRKLRLLLILSGLGALALISTVFGMMMAVASDLPQLENQQQYKHEANSFLYDDHWRPIGLFAPPNNVVIDHYSDISPAMQDAIVSIEDKRFWNNPGVDIRGIARAFVADITGGSRQGASTIAQQFVKNALSEQNNRTVLEKLREAALAYHLTRRWSKQKILTEYLNSIYFGNGAYGVESAARVYFGKKYGFAPAAGSPSGTTSTSTSAPSGGCGDAGSAVKCAAKLTPADAALLAGMVASPTAFDPVAHPHASLGRRNLVLKNMMQQGYITRPEYRASIATPLPTANDIQQPSEPTAAPYFTSWLRPQILAAVGHGVPPNVAEYRAYFGGLKIRTTLDLDMQHAAEQAVSANLPYSAGAPAASLVAIDNRTGEVRAMVGGPIVNGTEDYDHYPFNLATEGHRQPGSSFKPFTLAVALQSGKYGPSSIIDSAPQDFIVPGSGGREHFIVHNFGNTYSGPISLAAATAISDNSVYSQVGINVGTKRIARLARRMGVRSPISTNYAMILGGLKVGVSPLDMAHAYETFATGGRRVFNPVLGAPDQGPTGIAEIQCPVCKHTDVKDKPTYERVLPAPIAKTVHDILTGVVTSGTGTQAAISGVDVAGKTGTTSNYGDAWFVGWTPQMTVAVWVGVPDKLVSMATDYNGNPVEGGTYPAIIWQNFMTQALQILANEHQLGPQTSSTTSSSVTDNGLSGTSATSSATATSPSYSTSGATGATGGGTTGGGGTIGTGAGTTGGGGGTTGGGGGTTGPAGGGGTTGTGGGGGTTGTGGGGGTTGTGGGTSGAGGTSGTGGIGIGGGGPG
jgi:penicillin-binding protein 1A